MYSTFIKVGCDALVPSSYVTGKRSSFFPVMRGLIMKVPSMKIAFVSAPISTAGTHAHRSAGFTASYRHAYCSAPSSQSNVMLRRSDTW